MKKIFIFSSLTLLSTVQIYGMKRDWSSTDMAQPSQQAPQAAAGIDPNHYGPLAISNPDPADANSLMEHISHLPYYTDHQNTRNRIANAIICGKYTRSFAKFATEKNDVPLWELLISYRQLIKKQHKIDVIDTPKNPPLFDTTSIQIASLLVEKGHASISQNVGESGETVIHRACYYNNHPNLLQYYLTKHPHGVHGKDNQGNTPLFTLCNNGFGSAYPKMHYLNDVITKLALLKKAGISFFCKNNDHQSVVNIVQKQIPTMQANDADTITKFLQEHIIAVMDEQRKSKLTEAQKEDCTICTDPLATDGKPLETDDQVKMLECLHFFHTKCINEWHAKAATCPTCRVAEPGRENEENDWQEDWDEDDDSDNDADNDSDDDSDDSDWDASGVSHNDNPVTTSRRNTRLRIRQDDSDDEPDASDDEEEDSNIDGISTRSHEEDDDEDEDEDEADSLNSFVTADPTDDSDDDSSDSDDDWNESNHALPTPRRSERLSKKQ